MIQRIPGGAKWLVGIFAEAAVAVAEGVTLAQAILIGSLAAGLLAIFAQPAGSKDEFPNLSIFFKSVDVKLLAKFSSFIASKKMSTEQAVKLFKGVKPENMARAMEKIIALSGDPAWKKTSSTRQRELVELKQLLPSLSDKTKHYVPDHLSGIATLINIKLDEWVMSYSGMHDNGNNDGYRCEVKIEIIPEYPILGAVFPQDTIRNNQIVKGIAEFSLYGASLKDSSPIPARLKTWRRKRILNPVFKNNLKDKSILYTSQSGIILERLYIYKNGTLIVRPQCQIKSKWVDAHQIVRNHSSQAPYIIHSMTTPVGVQVQAQPFDHNRPSWPPRR
jgi:hypothetical protein